MNVMARKYHPTPTAGGKVTAPRPASGGSGVGSARKSPASAAGRDSQRRSPVAASPVATGFDYEAEVRRLCGQAPRPLNFSESSELQPGRFDSRVAPREPGSPSSPSSPSRFRWVQPKEDADTQPPQQRPQRELGAAARARNRMYRPVEQPKGEIDTTTDEWRRMTPAQRASAILGRSA